MDNASVKTVYRACHLCEAICGLEFKIDGHEIVSIRGDEQDPFSRGHICPKAVAIKDIHEDPNRLRHPVQRVGDTWHEISWDEAIALAADKLSAIQAQHGNNAVGFYAGNPSVHNAGTLFSIPALARSLKTKNMFSATSVDQLPQQLVSFLMFGHQFLIPIPDIDHTQHMLILGGNPIASNGSLMTVPDVANRLKAIRARGGKIVVIDPRRTETAEVADQYHAIRPGTDAALLMAMINVLRADGKICVREPALVDHLDSALDAIAHVSPESAARVTGIEATTIRALAHEFAAAPSAVCYGRIGTTLQSFGTLCQWLIQLLNLVTGNLDRVGGTMPTQPLLPITGPGTKPGHFAAWHSRVSALPEFAGELPSAALAEEMLTPGDGQVRGFISVCGNPVLSTPNGRQLDRALAGLEFMVSIDIYLNETTRHADLILPPTSNLHHDHYDYVFNSFAVRNVARYNEKLWQRPDDEREDWEILTALAEAIAQRTGRDVKKGMPLATQIGAMLTAVNGGSLDSLRTSTHGRDMGALTPSLMSRLETADKKIDCAPAVVLADLPRFNRDVLDAPHSASLLLIGRRHVRSNNSWMHVSHRLVKGKHRHQLMMHPSDLTARGLSDGQLVTIEANVGAVHVAVQASDDMMPGVVCLPHGWGHNRSGTKLGLAHENPGVSYNDLADHRAVDAVSGNAALNGIAVDVRAT